MFYTANIQNLVRQEIKQREEEGCSVAKVRKEYQRLCDDKHPPKDFEDLYDVVEKIKAPKNYAEPSDLKGIKKQRLSGPRKMDEVFSYHRLFDKIYGAWLGRSAGCLLGKPV